jgi:hypothetical protein
VTSSSQTPPLAEEEAPFLNTFMSMIEQKSLSWIPTGLETKNCCAGDDQQQFNRPLKTTDKYSIHTLPFNGLIWTRTFPHCGECDCNHCHFPSPHIAWDMDQLEGLVAVAPATLTFCFASTRFSTMLRPSKCHGTHIALQMTRQLNFSLRSVDSTSKFLT